MPCAWFNYDNPADTGLHEVRHQGLGNAIK
jgi:hypothetical protein